MGALGVWFSRAVSPAGLQAEARGKSTGSRQHLPWDTALPPCLSPGTDCPLRAPSSCDTPEPHAGVSPACGMAMVSLCCSKPRTQHCNGLPLFLSPASPMGVVPGCGHWFWINPGARLVLSLWLKPSWGYSAPYWHHFGTVDSGQQGFLSSGGKAVATLLLQPCPLPASHPPASDGGCCCTLPCFYWT